MPASGQATSGVLLVGDLPTEQEALVGQPFIGLQGFYLDRVLKRAGIDKRAFAIGNVLSCNGALTAGAIDHCSPYLARTIRDQRPKVIVALGDAALNRLVENATDVERYRGFVLDGKSGVPVIATYHPSFLVPRKGQANTARYVGVVARDLRKALRIAQDGFTRVAPSYTLDPKPDEFAMWVARFEQAFAEGLVPFLTFDIETPWKKKKRNEDDLPEENAEGVIRRAAKLRWCCQRMWRNYCGRERCANEISDGGFLAGASSAAWPQRCGRSAVRLSARRDSASVDPLLRIEAF